MARTNGLLVIGLSFALVFLVFIQQIDTWNKTSKLQEVSQLTVLEIYPSFIGVLIGRLALPHLGVFVYVVGSVALVYFSGTCYILFY